MKKVGYKFKVSLNEFEDIIWREILVDSKARLADLAYVILASFETDATHLYNIEYKGLMYECFECDEIEYPYEIATDYKLSQLSLNLDDKLLMTYDFGSDWKLTISLIEIIELNGVGVPKIVAGKGKGIPEDIFREDLRILISSNDSTDKSDHKYLELESLNKSWIYNEYDINEDNDRLIKVTKTIKKGYEG